MKRCGRCTRVLPLTSFNFRHTEGRPMSYCKQCGAADCAQRRKRVYVKPVHVSDPLNLALRDMPGSRVSLLGIADLVLPLRITLERMAA